MNKNAKVQYKFRVGDYFRQGMPYELILVQGSALYNQLTCNGNGPTFTNEHGDGQPFRTTIICDGFDTDDTRAIFIYYDEKEKKPMRFTIKADVLVRAIGLRDDGTLGETSQDDHICITRIPTVSHKGVPEEDCFGSVHANVPSFMLEHVLQRVEFAEEHKRYTRIIPEDVQTEIEESVRHHIRSINWIMYIAPDIDEWFNNKHIFSLPDGVEFKYLILPGGLLSRVTSELDDIGIEGDLDFDVMPKYGLRSENEQKKIKMMHIEMIRRDKAIFTGTRLTVVIPHLNKEYDANHKFQSTDDVIKALHTTDGTYRFDIEITKSGVEILCKDQVIEALGELKFDMLKILLINPLRDLWERRIRG